MLATLQRIAIDKKTSPQVFAFFHSGITMACGALRSNADKTAVSLREPAILDGCQTVSTISRFVNTARTKGVPDLDVLAQCRVQVRFIESDDISFLSQVTINNNRQVALPPWAFRANDDVQIRLQERLRDELRIYYERQDGMHKQEKLQSYFASEYANSPTHAISMRDLSPRIAAAMGDLRNAGHRGRLFESDEKYGEFFAPGRIEAVDVRALVLVWRVGQWIGHGIDELNRRYPDTYSWSKRAKYLISFITAQLIMQKGDLLRRASVHCDHTNLKQDFNDLLREVVSSQGRMVLSQMGLSDADHPAHARKDYISSSIAKAARKALLSKKLRCENVWTFKLPA